MLYCVMQKGESTWPGWSKDCLRDWWPFVKLAVPSECFSALWGVDRAAGGGGGVGGCRGISTKHLCSKHAHAGTSVHHKCS